MFGHSVLGSWFEHMIDVLVADVLVQW